MICVENATKRYGEKVAVDDLSFEVPGPEPPGGAVDARVESLTPRERELLVQIVVFAYETGLVRPSA